MDTPTIAPVQPRPLRAPGAAGSDAAMRRAAQDFEAQALGILMQPIFATVDTAGSRFGGGAAEAQWRPLLVDAYAAAAVRSGHGIGLADAVLRELQRLRGADTTPNTGEITP
ncbi:chemotaxis protein chel [Roseomonas terrae]|jgi:flagellar protein FlgJ|uniref:Chemotaxis protein chel n=1 Tax=Neoroseomonas terrae TaxID=424799 RepID=A0ABS5EJ10_9PROT|nr:rod-binding protein [Neoroseomonas terrae]MBR0651013.1 chemotaxis protein chel [Neoroseomonas terrae]